MSFHEYKEYIRNKTSEEVAAKDNTFNPEFEEMLNRRIEKLDKISKRAFQQVRDNEKAMMFFP